MHAADIHPAGGESLLTNEPGGVIFGCAALLPLRDLVPDCKCLYDGAALVQMAWEQLHTGNWKDVALSWRDAYALACILVALPAAVLEASSAPLPAAADASAADACAVTAAPAAAEVVQASAPAPPGLGSQAEPNRACDLPEPGADGDLAALHAHALHLHAGGRAGRAGGPDLALAPVALREWEGRVQTAMEDTAAALKQLDLGAMMGGSLFRLWLDRAIDLLVGQHQSVAWLLGLLQQQQHHREQGSSNWDRPGDCCTPTNHPSLDASWEMR